MTYLPTLIKKIDSFYKMAQVQSERELYSELAQASKEILNPEVAYTIKILAAMFLKAIEINDGFNIIYKTIDGITTDLDPEEPEQMEVERLLNNIGSAIRARASRPDSQNALRVLQDTASEVKRELANEELEKFPDNNEEEGTTSEISAYEAALSGYNEADGNDKGSFDFSGGQNDGATKNRGYSFGDKKNYKDWAQLYQQEKTKYNNALNGSESLLSKTNNAARLNSGTRNNLKQIEIVLSKLESLTKEAVGIEDKILLETELPHPVEEKRLEEIKRQLRPLEKERQLLKNNIHRSYQLEELKELQTQLPNIKENTGLKRLMREKIKLQELKIKNVSGKGKEAEQRQMLIDALTNDPNLSQDQINKYEKRIYDAAQITNRITENKIRRAEEFHKMRGTTFKDKERTTVPTREERLKGGIKFHEYNLSNAQLSTYIKNVTDQALTKRKTFKDRIFKQLNNSSKEAELKPFIDDVATAANKGQNIGWATKRLRQKMVEISGVNNEVIAFLLSIRVSKLFYQYRDQLKLINENWLGIDKKDTTTVPDFSKLNAEQIAYIVKVIEFGKDLVRRFESYKAKLPGSKFNPEWQDKTFNITWGNEIAGRGNSPTDIVKRITSYLEGNIKNISSNEQASENVVAQSKRTFFESIVKMAFESAEAVAPKIDDALDEDGKELAEKIFHQLAEEIAVQSDRLIDAA